VAIVTLRLFRRETLKRALAGLTVAVVFAARSGEARGFFCSPSASTPLTRSSSPRQRSARRWGIIHRLLYRR
jgi:hypothetical protein